MTLIGRRLMLATLAITLIAAMVQGQTPSSQGPGTMLRRWVQFKIVNGRLAATNSQQINSNISNWSNSPSSGRSERLTIDVSSGTPSVRYEFTTPQEDFDLKLAGEGELTIRRTRRAGSNAVSLELRQQPNQELAITLDEGKTPQVFRSPTIWRLLIAEPDIARKYLLPLFEVLRTPWKLGETALEIEQTLFRRAHEDRQPERIRWSEAVDALASPRFADREAAQRRLERAGVAVRPYLESRLRAGLDAEQRQRIRELIDRPATEQEDSAERAATSLAEDEQLWIALLGRDDEAQRRLARRQVTMLLGKAVDFDPAASDEVREAQILKLKASFPAPVQDASPADKPGESPER